MKGRVRAISLHFLCALCALCALARNSLACLAILFVPRTGGDEVGVRGFSAPPTSLRITIMRWFNSKARPAARCRPAVEALEKRDVPAVSVSHGTLLIVGTSHADTAVVNYA